MLELDYLGDLNEFWSSDELIDGDRYQFLVNYWHYLFDLNKDFLYLLNPCLNLHQFFSLHLHHHFFPNLNYLLNFNSHDFPLLNWHTLDALFHNQLFFLD